MNWPSHWRILRPNDTKQRNPASEKNLLLAGFKTFLEFERLCSIGGFLTFTKTKGGRNTLPRFNGIQHYKLLLIVIKIYLKYDNHGCASLPYSLLFVGSFFISRFSLVLR